MLLAKYAQRLLMYLSYFKHVFFIIKNLTTNVFLTGASKSKKAPGNML